MRVRVFALRKRGRRSGSYGLERPEGVEGELGMHSVASGETSFTVATIRAGLPKDAAPLPDLFEPVLVNIGNNALLLRGFETSEGVAYVQEWRCVFEA